MALGWACPLTVNVYPNRNQVLLKNPPLADFLVDKIYVFAMMVPYPTSPRAMWREDPKGSFALKQELDIILDHESECLY